MSKDHPYGKEMIGDDDEPTFHSDNVPDHPNSSMRPPLPATLPSDIEDDQKLSPMEIELPEEQTNIKFRGRTLTLTGRKLRAFLLGANFILLIFSLGILIGAGYNSTTKVFALIDTWFTLALLLGFFLLCLSLLGCVGAVSQSRVMLWMYALLLLLLAVIDMAVSSYALSMAENGEKFLTNAWDISPAGLRDNLQVTFECCGLMDYLDSRAVLPCPDGSGDANSTYTPKSFVNATGQACMAPMVAEFNEYSLGVPTVGLLLAFVMLVVAFCTWQLIRAIASSIREGDKETL